MLALFTDYGWQDPYVGQLKARLLQEAPGVPVIDLLHGVPDFNAHAGAHLLAALAPTFPEGTVFLGVIDPGVGGPRQAVVVEAAGRWYVGPDNGLFSIVAGRAASHRCWRIEARPEGISDTFHGRDLFAPVAAKIARGDWPSPGDPVLPQLEVRFDLADLPRIVYLDHYGNAWTGLRAELMAGSDFLEVKGTHLPYFRIFSEAGKGEVFWYRNSVGLVEIAANRSSAAAKLDLKVGDLVRPAGSPDSRWH